MKIIEVEQKTPEWLEVRRGKVTGTGLKKIVGGPKTRENYLYEVLAERIAVPDGSDLNEMPIDRGVRLEDEARQAFEKKTGKKVEQVGFVQSDFDKNAGHSPDGLIRKGKKYPEEVEIKNLSSANHVRIWLENRVPDEHMPQIIQAFIVNDELQTKHFVSYDPRIRQHPLHIIKVEREDVEGLIEDYRKAEKQFLKEVDDRLSKIVKL